MTNAKFLLEIKYHKQLSGKGNRDFFYCNGYWFGPAIGFAGEHCVCCEKVIKKNEIIYYKDSTKFKSGVRYEIYCWNCAPHDEILLKNFHLETTLPR